MKRMRWLMRSAKKEAGFSLLECVLALALLAMLMALLPQAVRFAKRTTMFASSLSASSSSSTSIAAVERLLSGAMPQLRRDDDGALRIAFSGEPQSLSFVAPLLAAPQGPGLYRFTLLSRSKPGTATTETILQAIPWHELPVSAAPASSVPDERLLIAARTSATFRYFGPAPGSAVPAWQSSWQRTDRLPDLVEIVLPPDARSGLQPAPVVVELKLRQRRPATRS